MVYIIVIIILCIALLVALVALGRKNPQMSLKMEVRMKTIIDSLSADEWKQVLGGDHTIIPRKYQQAHLRTPLEKVEEALLYHKYLRTEELAAGHNSVDTRVNISNLECELKKLTEKVKIT